MTLQSAKYLTGYYKSDTRKAHNKQTVLNLHHKRYKSRNTKKTNQNPKN